MRRRIPQFVRGLFLTPEQRAIAQTYKDFTGARGAVRIAALVFCVRNGVPLMVRETPLNGWTVGMLLRGNERALLRELLGAPENFPPPSDNHPPILLRTDPERPLNAGSRDLRPVIEYAAKHDPCTAKALEEARRAEERFRQKHPEFYAGNPDMFVY